MDKYLTVNVQNLRDNIINIKKSISPSMFCAVVKANCYGLGISLCKYIDDLVDYYAVSNVEEADELRIITTKPILILVPQSCDTIIKCSKDYHFAVDDIAVLKKLSKCNKKLNIHLCVNTGMNRYGINTDNVIDYLGFIRQSDNLSLCGVFSHFYSSDKISQLGQYQKFKCIEKLVKKYYSNVIFHISASSGVRYKMDMARIGIDLYNFVVGNIVSFSARVIKTRIITRGESVSYDAKFIADRKMEIAIVSAGYADGIKRCLTGHSVSINGKMCKIIGNVCMDCFMVDITGKNVKVGDFAVIFGDTNKHEPSICNLAQYCDTISYEILTGIGSRVERMYICK